MGCLVAVKNNLPVLVKARILAPQDNKKAAPSSPSTHPHSTLRRRFYQLLTLSAGECKVSGGESKVSRRVGLPRNPHARSS
jgi:hypothetical protein